MDIDYCAYHYQQPATWYCRHCGRYLGDCCISRSQAEVKHPRCYLCSTSLDPLGAANAVEPFWNSIHRFLAYPFKVGPLILIVVLSLIASQMTMGILGIVLMLLIVVVATRYAYAIIDEARNGRTTPPSLAILFTLDEDRLFLKQIAVFILAGLVIGGVQMLDSTFLSLIAMGFFMLALPASILVLATEKSFVAAINPLLLSQLMLKMGTGYLVLYAFVNIINGGPSVVFEHFAEDIPPHLLMPVLVGINVYFGFVTAYLMGYALLQYQKVLGYRADLESNNNDSMSFDRVAVDDILKEMNILQIEGRFEEATDMAKKNARNFPNDMRLHLRLNRLLAERQKKEELIDNSNALIEKLIKANSSGKAAEVFIGTLKTIPDFQIDNAENIDALAEHFQMVGQYKTALVLISQLTKEYPDYKALPEAILRAAQIYAEFLNQPDQAKSILKRLINSMDTPKEVREKAEKIQEVLSE